MLLFNGLGALPVALRNDTNFVRPGQTSAGVFVEPKRTGWTRFAIDTQLRKEGAEGVARAQAFSDKLLATYGDKIPNAPRNLDGIRECRQGRLTPDNPDVARVLYPLGAVVVLGVPFSPEAWKDNGHATLEQTYTPDAHQQWLADVQIYMTSQRALAKAVDKDLASVEYDLANLWLDLAQPAVPGKVAPRGIQRVVDQKLNGYTVDAMLKEGRWTVNFPGYSLNPIPPTPAERTQKGGLRAYYARGGYLLETRALTGKRRVQGRALNIPLGFERCSTATHKDFTKPYVAADTASNIGRYGEGWDVFVTVGPQYQLRVAARDPGWWTSSRGWVLNKLASIPDAICSKQDLIQAAAAMYPPTGPEKLGVDVARGMLAKNCAGRAPSAGPQSFVPPPPAAPVPSPPPPKDEAPSGLSPLQLGGLALAGMLTGVLIARRVR